MFVGKIFTIRGESGRGKVEGERPGNLDWGRFARLAARLCGRQEERTEGRPGSGNRDTDGQPHSHARRAVAEGLDQAELDHVALLAITAMGWSQAISDQRSSI